MEHLYQNVVKISCDVEQGSGILFYPKEGPYIIIISAKHVLNKEDICNYKIENISVSFGGFINVNLNKSLGDQFLFDDEFDLGAIVILKSRINENITINFLKAVDRKFDFKSCVSLGYPEKNKNDIKSIKSTYRAQLESTNFIFESVLSEEYLEELSSSSFDNLVGMSGGGLFYHNSSEYYLSGINFEFRNGYKSFYTINILKVNEFLEKNKLSKIPLTYGSANGINSNWINTKHSQALKELGERYTNEIESLEVPIVQYFKYLELGRTFTEDIELHFHQFILTLRSSKNVLNNDTTKDFFDKTSIFSDFLVRNFKELNWIVGGFDNSVLPLDELEKYRIGVRKTIEELRVEKLNILNKRIQVAKKGGKNIDTYHDNPLSDELNALYKIENDLDQFIKYLNGDKIKIGQNGLLVITGNAGNGKSHLLGDITKLRIEKDLPSILVLGEKLQGNNNPREQILNILSLGLYSWQELLINLNEIGKFKGERFIFAIDALNEGNGRNIWPVYLASFIDEFKNYPYIGLVLSIRSTYLNVILPEAKFNNNEIVKIEHRGFQGMGLKALSHFCKCFNLNQPVLPLLSPEFTNPQFLLLTCKTLKMLGRNDFPRGMQGISKLYKDYTVAVTQKFRLNLNYDIPITLDIVEHFIFFIQSKLPGVKKLDDVYMAFEEYSYKSLVPHLINDLIRENIFSEELAYLSPKEPDVVIIKFTYEKFANHIAAKMILDEYDKDSIKSQFETGYYFHIMCENKYLLDEGLLEALTIQIPELFRIEIFELFSKEWLDQFKWGTDKFGQIKKVWLNSLLWRLSEDINIKICKSFINSYILTDHNLSKSLIDVFINLAIIKDHPFNAFTLHEWLMKMPMADRDIKWTKELYLQFNTYLDEGEENEYAISRMIDWVLELNEHSQLDNDTRYLYCLTLSWFLGSNFQPLRDAATIGLVKLTEDHIDILIRLLEIFEKVNDDYIIERLIAAGYGVILRSSDNAKISDLGTCIYITYFEKSSLPAHIMVRDYARCIIEYAVYNNKNHKFNLSKVRPPYGSKMIKKLPSEKTCRKHELQFKKGFSYPKEYCYRGNHFIFDKYFGIDSDKLGIRTSIENFYKIPFRTKSNYQKVVEELSREKRQLIHLKRASDLRSKGEIKSSGFQLSFIERLLQGSDTMTEDKLSYSKITKRLNLKNNLIQRIMRLKNFIHTKKLEGILTKRELENYHNYVIPYFNLSKPSKSRYDNILEDRDYLPWIVNQIFKKGYKNSEHGLFDGQYINGHYSAKIEHQKYGGHLESFGEKYGNIASDQLLARISDNYDIIKGWGNYNIVPYNYAREIVKWQDIDPSNLEFYIKNKKSTKEQSDTLYFNWSRTDWLKIDDWPKISSLITYKDENKEVFLNLLCERSFEEPINIGEEKYHVDKKQLNLFGHAFIVKSSDLNKILKGLKKRDNNHHISTMFSSHNVYNREFYWSENYSFAKLESDENQDFNYFGPGWLMHIPLEIYQIEGNNFQYQTSKYKISKLLFDGLGLKYSKNDKILLNQQDVTVVCNFELPFENLFINKKILLDYLKDRGYSLVYANRGEKMDVRYDSHGVISGVYRQYYVGTHYFDENGELIEYYKLSNKDPIR